MVTTLAGGNAATGLDQHFARYGIPEIIYPDQGNQVTAEDFCKAAHKRGRPLSTDFVLWRDNVIVDRFWPTIKLDERNVTACDSVAAARQGIERFVPRYSSTRARSFVGMTPIKAYSPSFSTAGDRPSARSSRSNKRGHFLSWTDTL